MNEIKKILVPVDFSENSLNALTYANNFAKCFQSKLFLIYVVEPIIYPSDFGLGQVSLVANTQEIIDHSKEELEKLAKREISKPTEFEIIIKRGRPFIEIIDTASEIDADIIIIATHGHTGVDHLLFGSTAEKVVRKAPCPVLTVRNPIKGFNYKNNK